MLVEEEPASLELFLIQGHYGFNMGNGPDLSLFSLGYLIGLYMFERIQVLSSAELGAFRKADP